MVLRRFSFELITNDPDLVALQLVAAFLTDVLIWGFPSSSGILLAAYLGNPVYSSQHSASSLLPLIGTLCTGIMYCSGKYSGVRLALSS